MVFLQEVIQRSEDIISEKCPTYHFVPAAEESYYTAMMLRTEFVEVEDTIIMPFPSSMMGRNVLAVKVRSIRDASREDLCLVFHRPGCTPTEDG